jgi:hypothetical protein
MHIGKKFLFLFFLLLQLICNSTLAQVPLSINGTVKDAATGEVLIGASTYLLENPQKITLTNGYGFFSITVKPGQYRLVVASTGYQTDTLSVELTTNQTLVIKL